MAARWAPTQGRAGETPTAPKTTIAVCSVPWFRVVPHAAGQRTGPLGFLRTLPKKEPSDFIVPSNPLGTCVHTYLPPRPWL